MSATAVEPVRAPTLLAPRRVQARLRVGAVDDPLEREADAIADRVLRMPDPGPAVLRRCPGGCPPGGCGDDEKVLRRRPRDPDAATRELQPGRNVAEARSAGPGGAMRVDVPTARLIEGERGGGSRLPGGPRAFFERRLGVDMSHVRVHADDRAARLARSVEAKAFTIGDDVFFGAGQYQPDTGAGRRLLAHELAHVLQQRGSSPAGVQRYATCEPRDECPPREPGEIGRASRGAMDVGGVSGPVSGLLVWDFAVGRADLKPGLDADPTWTSFTSQVAANPDVRWEVLGFSDCPGSEALNTDLRQQRAAALTAALSAAARAQVVNTGAAPLSHCMAANTSEEERAQNRSAFLRQHSSEVTFAPEQVTASLCGPDVTDWLVAQMNANQDHPVIKTGREHRWPRWVPVFNVGWTVAALADFAELVKPGGPWDFKRSEGWWRAGQGSSCPTRDCDRTVTLCGHCVNYDVPGNIHYAWVGRRMELAPWLLRVAPAPVQEGGAYDDDPPDTVAINIGIAMADQGRSLCPEVRSKLNQLNREGVEGCSVCR